MADIEVVAGSSCTLGGNVYTVASAAPKTSGTIYAAVKLNKPGDTDHGKYWDTNAGGSWQASPTTWPTATYAVGSFWYYAVPTGATTGKAGGDIVLIDLTDNIATPASSTTISGGLQQALVVTAATSGYLAKLDDTITSRAAAATALTNATWTDTRAGKLDNLDTTVGSRLATSGYTAPDNSSIGAIKLKTDNLPAVPASQADVTGSTATIAGRCDTLDASVGLRLLASGYTAPDNVSIGAIKAKTDNLPASPASTSEVAAVTTYVDDRCDTIDAAIALVLPAASYVAPDNATIGLINGRLPVSPASTSEVAAVTTYVDDRCDTIDAAIEAIHVHLDINGLYTLTIETYDAELVRLPGVIISIESPTGDVLWRAVSSGAKALVVALDAGDYVVRVSKPGYLIDEPSTPITISDDATLELTLEEDSEQPAMCQIYGVITGPTGPIVGAIFALEVVTPSELGGWNFGGAAQTTTADDGSFSLAAPQGARIAMTCEAIGWEREIRIVPASVSRAIAGWSA